MLSRSTAVNATDERSVVTGSVASAVADERPRPLLKAQRDRLRNVSAQEGTSRGDTADLKRPLLLEAGLEFEPRQRSFGG
jgi:hypothetical protein